MMCKVLTYEQIDRAEWSRLVQASTTGTWFQTPEAYDFFASQPELFMPFVIGIACDPAGTQTHLHGVCVGYVTVEKNPIKQFLTRRAIINGGPALTDDVTDDEVTALMTALNKELQNKTIYIETRNFNDYSKWKGAFKNAGFSYQRHLNFHVHTNQSWKTIARNIFDFRFVTEQP